MFWYVVLLPLQGASQFADVYPRCYLGLWAFASSSRKLAMQHYSMRCHEIYIVTTVKNVLTEYHHQERCYKNYIVAMTKNILT